VLENINKNQAEDVGARVTSSHWEIDMDFAKEGEGTKRQKRNFGFHAVLRGVELPEKRHRHDSKGISLYSIGLNEKVGGGEQGNDPRRSLRGKKESQ